MAKGRLFEYAIIHHPEKKTKEDPQRKSVLIQAPQSILASDDKEVAIVAARAIPEEFLDKLSEVEIVVRPF